MSGLVNWIKKHKGIMLMISGLITGAALTLFLFDIFSIKFSNFTFTNDQYSPNNPTINVGIDENYPPYEYIDDGVIVGYNVDIMRASAHAAGYNVNFVANPWSTTLEMVNNGNLDALAGMYMSETRKETYTFSTPHSFVTAGLFSKFQSHIEELTDLPGRTVIVQQGDIMDEYLHEQSMDIHIIQAQSAEEMIRRLINNEADAALFSSVSQGRYYLDKYDNSEIEVHNLNQPPRAYSFAALKNNQELIDELDAGLQNIKRSGQYDAINSQWFVNNGNDNHLRTIRMITYLAFFILLILIFFIIWNQALKRQVNRKTDDLLRSQKKFQAIFENTTEGIMIVHQQKIIFANPKALEVLNISESEMADFDLFAKIHPMDYTRIRDYYRKRLEGESIPNQYTYRMFGPNNQIQWMMNNVILTDWDDKKVHLIYFTDITKIKESEIALEQSEERQKLALEASKDAIWDFNLLEGETYFSPQFYLMLDYEPDEFPATLKNWMDLIHQDDRKRCISILNKHLDKPDNTSHELIYRMETKHGQHRWIHTKFKVTSYETGTVPRRMSGVHTDITKQKDYEETIRKERDVLDQIMQTSNNGFIVTDKDGIVKYINPTAHKMLIPEGEYALGKNYTEFGYRVFDAGHQKELNSKKLMDYLIESSDQFLTIERVIDIGNSSVHVLVNVAKLRSNENDFEGMVISIIDITEIESAKKELIEREKRIRQIIQYSPFGIIMMDNELNIITASEHFIEDFKLDSDIPEMISLENYAPLVFYRWEHIFKAALQGIRQGNLQDPFTQGNGDEEFVQWLCCPWYTEGDKIGGIMFYTEVITSEVLAYDALQQSEDKFAKTFHTSPDSITISRLEDGLYLDVNFGFTEITGYTRDEVIGRTVKDINIWGDFSHRLEIQDVLLKSGEINNFQTSMRMKDGTLRQALISARMIEINHERCLITIGRDITEIVEANEKIQQMNQELEQRIRERTIELERKNEELETFTYTVSHDLKAPLRGIDGYSRLLLEDYQNKLDEDGRYFLQNIRNSTTYMDRLINDLLDYSRLERRSIAPKRFNLPELIDRIINEYVHSNKDTQLNVDLQVREIKTDYESLLQILRNLIDNAYKFTRNNIQHEVSISSYLENGHCLIKIKDNGIGFDNKYKENIFKIFNRLHSQDEYPGTGIGLTIVKKGIDRIGAEIIADGQINQGAEFIIKIPQLESEKNK